MATELPKRQNDFSDPASLVPQGQPLDFPSPLHLLEAVAPDMAPYDWQREELLRLGGYLNPYDLSTRFSPTRQEPLLYTLCAANGSGKDQYIIGPLAVWFAVSGIKNRFIGTSSSFDQVKGQTEPSIKALIARIEALFGPIFRSVEFHHLCLLTGSEIKLFATDRPANAEGHHPWRGGRMMVCINEAKSIEENIYYAISRSEGYAYWVEVSSTGAKSGRFYNHCSSADKHPAPLTPSRWWNRTITAWECPHISAGYIERFIAENPKWLVDSSLRSMFANIDTECLIIPEQFVASVHERIPEAQPGEIGIGLDTAGGVDENSCYVRLGNQIVHQFHFCERDFDIAAARIDAELMPWKQSSYIFNADDGGISRAIVDNLVKTGWQITRRLNQSPAYNSKRFLNLGIEMYWHVRTLIIRKEIQVPVESILVKQLTSRRYDGSSSSQGKLKIEPKPVHRSREQSSPDRADAFVLCFFSYKSEFFTPRPAEPGPRKPKWTVSRQTLIDHYGWEELKPEPSRHGYRFTFQDFNV